MPRDPGEAFQVAVTVDDEKRWRLRLNSVVEVESEYKERRKDAVFLSWRFSLHDIDTGAAVTDDNSGDMYELWHPTNDSTFYDPKAKPPKLGGAREMAHVLMGRELSDAEIQDWNADGIEGWNAALADRTMLADLEWGVDKKGYNRLKIIRMRPDPKGVHTRTVAAPPVNGPATPPSATPPTAETPAERKARLLAELEAIDA